MSSAYSISFNKRYYRALKNDNFNKMSPDTWVLYYNKDHSKLFDGQLKDRDEDWDIVNVELKKGNS